MKKSPEAVYNTQDIFELNAAMIRGLKKKALGLPRKRFRLCLHNSPDNQLQEMIIVARKGSYIRPHRHPKGKSESYHLIQGAMTVYYFDDDGKVTRAIKLSKVGRQKSFLQRLSSRTWHMPVVTSPWVVYHETYPGPFIKEVDVEFPSWAPEEKDTKQVKCFFSQIKKF